MTDTLISPAEEVALPTLRHGIIIARLATILSEYVAPRGLGIVCAPQATFAVRGNPPTREPDLAFVARDRVPADLDTEATFAPDLAVEVVSRTDTYDAVATKVGQYLDAGTQVVWVVRPKDRTVEAHRRGVKPTLLGAGPLSGDPAIPGFTIDIDEVFAV